MMPPSAHAKVSPSRLNRIIEIAMKHFQGTETVQ